MNLTYIIIIVTSFVSFYAFSQTEVLRKFMFNPYIIDQRNQYYRFITSGLIHKDFVHLIFNMVSLYFFGEVVEYKFRYIFGDLSGLYFILFYLIAIIVAGLPSYVKHRHNPSYNALGASGGVSAVIFASILFNPTMDICFYFVLCLPGFILGTGYLIYSYFKGKNPTDNIGHDAHLYGALFGIMFCLLMYPESLGEFWIQLMNWDGFGFL